MDNSLSKINQINFLAESASHDQNTSKLKDKKDQDLINVANQFEAIFVHQMLKQARQGKLADGIFNSEAQDTFNNMLDIEYSQILSKKNNFGIAEALIQQFQPGGNTHYGKDEVIKFWKQLRNAFPNSLFSIDHIAFTEEKAAS